MKKHIHIYIYIYTYIYIICIYIIYIYIYVQINTTYTKQAKESSDRDHKRRVANETATSLHISSHPGDNMRANGTSSKWSRPGMSPVSGGIVRGCPLLGGTICPNVVFRVVIHTIYKNGQTSARRVLNRQKATMLPARQGPLLIYLVIHTRSNTHLGYNSGSVLYREGEKDNLVDIERYLYNSHGRPNIHTYTHIHTYIHTYIVICKKIPGSVRYKEEERLAVKRAVFGTTGVPRSQETATPPRTNVGP